nr:MAG: major capsid protein [Microviridae sp.]
MSMSRGRGSIFQSVSGLRPGRSVFNLSYEKKLTCDMGQLIPILCEEVVPGDKWIVGNEVVVRMGPMLAPILHEINLFVHYFFVPYRLLWQGDEIGPTSWEAFISGGPTGTNAATLPKWSPGNTALYSLWDYLGFPIGVAGSAAFRPMAFPMNAYNFIYNEYYRDQQQIAPVLLTQESILKRAWEKDYFTSSLPWTQRGTPPALPFSGSAVWGAPVSGTPDHVYGAQSLHTIKIQTAAANVIDAVGVGGTNPDYVNFSPVIPAAALNANTLTAATFGVNDLRLSFQIQKWLERNARAGIRYKEFLLSHFGVTVPDERLQRPEYLGGSKGPVIISEVLQTGVTTSGTPGTGVASMLGHGLGVQKNHAFKYFAKEWGLVMGIMSIMPRSGYSQGINRQWIKSTRYDFYTPEFAHLSEQPIFQGELFLDTVDADNNTVFGYQGRFDEMRFKPNMQVSLFAKGQALNYWHLAREFTVAPTLNQTFIECTPGKRVFQNQTADNAFYVNFANIIKAIRPMPFEPAPGLIDHF